MAFDLNIFGKKYFAVLFYLAITTPLLKVPKWVTMTKICMVSSKALHKLKITSYVQN